MKLKTVSKEELETMSYDDVAYIILKETKKKMKLVDLFDKVCEIMEIDEKQKDNYIADFFTLLSTEKRFINLDKGYWDLRENHTAKIELEDEVEEEEIEETEEEQIEEENDMYIDESKDIEDDETEDEYKDLVVMDEESEADL